MKRSWFLGTLVFLAACGEEPKDPLDWAIHPDVQGKDRAILRAALEVVIEECPALKEIDWEAAVKREGDDYAIVSFTPVRMLKRDFNDLVASPYINNWSYHVKFSLLFHGNRDWGLNFSWEEPPGIAAGTFRRLLHENEDQERKCNFNERRWTKFKNRDYREYFFKRVDRLADVVREVEATYQED